MRITRRLIRAYSWRAASELGDPFNTEYKLDVLAAPAIEVFGQCEVGVTANNDLAKPGAAAQLNVSITETFKDK